ncbi:MAG: DUF2802 domain-containing protein [Bdellovibrio sp.]|nr:MAG: DUF2802 domain-containing protein [Bdellovibrio sp.]
MRSKQPVAYWPPPNTRCLLASAQEWTDQWTGAVELDPHTHGVLAKIKLMISWAAIQVLFDVILLLGIAATWIRLSKPAKDDPRLSRGLQLLQSKIAVLEDLNDQTERKAHQIGQLLEAKARELQRFITEADEQIRKVEAAMGKSLEVAQIFQDRIPHEEIIDRKTTLKYIQAARLAHQGLEVDNIASQVDLSRAEIEFVAKVNRDQLQFSEEDLPDWAKMESPTMNAVNLVNPVNSEDNAKSDKPVSLSQLGDRFRNALRNPPVEKEKTEVESVGKVEIVEKVGTVEKIGTVEKVKVENEKAEETREHAGPVIRKVIFPRVESLETKIKNNLFDRNLG